MFKLVLEKAEEPEIKLTISVESSKKQEFQKNIYFYFIEYAKAFDCVDHNKLWKILKEMAPDLPLEKPVCRSGSNSQNWTWNNTVVPNRKRSSSRLYIVILLIYLYAEYIMRNAGLEEAQAGIKIAKRNINNLRYADDTTVMAESEEELKASWWKWKRRVKKLA